MCKKKKNNLPERNHDHDNKICAKKIIGTSVKFNFQIAKGDILKAEIDAVVLPIDHDLRFSIDGNTELYQKILPEVEEKFEQDTNTQEARVVQCSDFRLPNARVCYFCLLPAYLGDDEDERAIELIVDKVFDLVKNQKCRRLGFIPLTKKVGSYPITIVAKNMVWPIEKHIRTNLKSDVPFLQEEITIVCKTTAHARAFVQEILEMDMSYGIKFDDAEAEGGEPVESKK